MILILENAGDNDIEKEIEEAGWSKIKEKTDVYIKSQKAEGLINVLAFSKGRESKEIAIDELKEKRFTTNQTDLDADEIWRTYMTLTRVESAFRDLKSELGMRPIYHSKKERTSAHLFIGLLAYHLLISIETKLRAAGDHREWKKIKKILSTHQRTTVTIVGEHNEIYTVRVSSRPESEHQKIYMALGVSDRLKKLKSVIAASGD